MTPEQLQIRNEILTDLDLSENPRKCYRLLRDGHYLTTSRERSAWSRLGDIRKALDRHLNDIAWTILYRRRGQANYHFVDGDYEERKKFVVQLKESLNLLITDGTIRVVKIDEDGIPQLLIDPKDLAKVLFKLN